MDKKHILGSSGVNFEDLNKDPLLHIARKKSHKLLDALTAVGKEKGLKLFKTEVKNLFQSKFTGRSDYDKIKKGLAKKIFLYNLSKLRNRQLGPSENDIPLNLIIKKF